MQTDYRGAIENFFIAQISVNEGKILYVYNDGTWRWPAGKQVPPETQRKWHYWRRPDGIWQSVYDIKWEDPDSLRSRLLEKAYQDYVRQIVEGEQDEKRNVL